MKKFFKNLLVVIIVFVLVLAIAGCGSDKNIKEYSISYVHIVGDWLYFTRHSRGETGGDSGSPMCFR
jgi:hypothetical protein